MALRPGFEERDANTALIVAAPDLLEACEAVRDASTPEEAAWAYEDIIRAIAKATGALMTDHTPGSWDYGPYVVHDDDGNQAGRFLSTIDGDVIAYVDVTNEANARLIAAAPDMLEALAAVVADGDDSLEQITAPSWKQAIAALAKARGESHE